MEGDHYTVLLLNEDQLDRFLKRPGFKSLGSQFARTVDVWPRRTRVKALAVATGVALLAVVAALWPRATGGDATAAAVVAVHRPPARGMPLPTGASFSVQVTSFARDAEARAMAARLSRGGLTAFDWRLDGTQRDVLVGPFVSIDEAEAAQRAVARQGYPRARLYLDERLRTAVADATAESIKTKPSLVLVAAPGRIALAFELGHEPQQVSGQRVDPATFEVTTSAVGAAIDAQEWRVPADVQLLKHVTVIADPTGTRGLNARLTVAENAVATVRLEHNRVYVDVSRAQLDFDDGLAPPASRPVEARANPTPVQPQPAAPIRAVAAAPVHAPQPAPASRASAPAPAGSFPASSGADFAKYRQAIAPVFARFEEIQPFLRSAVGTPTPEVLAAIAGTFADLEQKVHAIQAPPSALSAHGLMLSAVQLARGAVAPSFAGDRMAQVREANAQFQAAKAQLH